MLKQKIVCALLGIGLLVAPLAGVASADQGTIKAGYLTCHVASGFGFIFGSSRKLACTYAAAPGQAEKYVGSISKFGADIGYLSSGILVWAVLAPTSTLKPGALAGHYAGATAGATVGVGAGVNVMTGGFEKSIALQPISIEGTNGLNVAAGVVSMSLKLKH